MTPEDKQALQEHTQAIAEILYRQQDSWEIQTLEDIETTVRQQMLEHVSPQVGFFYQRSDKNISWPTTNTQKLYRRVDDYRKASTHPAD